MISIRGLQLKYGEKVIFNDIDFTFKPNDKIGLIGRNGAGKTSLFHIMTNNLIPDSGVIEIPSSIRLSFLKQHLDINSSRSVIQEVLSVVENLEKLNRTAEKIRQKLEDPSGFSEEKQQKWIIQLSELHERINHTQLLRGETEVILKGLGFSQEDLDEPVNTFSGGWQMRVELAKILIQKPEYILLDEPTNYLDIESVIWFEQYLQKFAGAFMIVSHDKDFLDNSTEKTFELAMGELFTYQSPYTKAMKERSLRLQQQKDTREQQQKVIRQKQRTIDRFRAKASKRNMVKSMEKQLSKMDIVEVDPYDIKNVKIQFNEGPRSGEIVLETNQLSKSFGDNHVFSNVNFKVHRQKKLAIVGKNGEGKSTLIRLIAGHFAPTDGNFALGYNVSAGFYFQDHPENLDGEQTVFETMEAESPPEIYSRLRGILGAFLFSGDDIEKKVKVLSGGEKSRLALATLLLNPYNLLVLDEPTNHLDIPSKEILKKALMDFKGSLIIVSHDRQFLRGLTESTYEFSGGELHEHLGGIDDFLRKKNAESFREFELSGQTEGKSENRDPGSKSSSERQKNKKIMRSIQYAERNIEKLENEIVALEHNMAREGFYDDPEHIVELKRYNQLKEKLDEKYSEWDKLHNKLL